MTLVEVLAITALPEAAQNLVDCVKQAEDEAGRRLEQAESLRRSTEQEERISRGMLETAKAVELAAAAALTAASAAAAKAAAAEAAALATGDPLLVAPASAAALKTAADLAKAADKHRRAAEHRRRLERRHELSVSCLRTAESICDELKLAFHAGIASMKACAGKGTGSLLKAYKELRQYTQLPEPAADLVKVSSQWRSYSDVSGGEAGAGSPSVLPDEAQDEEEKHAQPVRPDEIREKFNMTEGDMLAVLAWLFDTDPKFREGVLSYRAQAELAGSRDSVERKIKKNMAGRLSEEMAAIVFGPLGERIETQNRAYTEDGRYTKTDLIVRGLKAPLILGKGQGMGAREGSDLAVEVKSGTDDYLWRQMSHMEFQAQGHRECEISCTVCSRDIKDLGSEREAQLRAAMRLAGSPIIGMLPYKREIDSACIKFVFGG